MPGARFGIVIPSFLRCQIFVAVMPAGMKMFCSRKSSNGTPETVSTICASTQ